MNNQLTTRHQLCGRLYRAGLQCNAAEVDQLLKQIDSIDRELAVPDVEPPVNVPEVDDLIYLPTRCSIDHGYDDVSGGVGVVKEVKSGISGGSPTSYITTHEQPGRGHNWEFLGPEQAQMKKHYGDRWARPDPDLGKY